MTILMLALLSIGAQRIPPIIYVPPVPIMVGDFPVDTLTEVDLDELRPNDSLGEIRIIRLTTIDPVIPCSDSVDLRKLKAKMTIEAGGAAGYCEITEPRDLDVSADSLKVEDLTDSTISFKSAGSGNAVIFRRDHVQSILVTRDDEFLSERTSPTKIVKATGLTFLMLGVVLLALRP